MKDLKAKALRGGFAKICSQAASFVLRIGSMVILARLLDPEDFGVVGMVTVVTGAFSLFKDAGLSVASVQRAVITDEQLSGLFWVNMLVGACLAFLTVAMAPLLVRFYREPQLFWVAAAMASGFMFNAAGVQHSAILQRQMRFVALSAIEIVSWAMSIAIGIILAWNGFGYWALVGMAVSLPVVSTAGLWFATKWVPQLAGFNAEIWSMIRFGGLLSLNTLVVYAAYNIDKLIIGRLWGAEALGIYGRAYQLISIPTENLNGAVGGVAVSALSRLQDDEVRFKSYFVKSYNLVLAVTLPVTIACALFADDIVLVLLGQKWLSAAPIFRLMAPTILAFALLNPLGWLLFASGRIKRSLGMAAVIAPVVMTGYVAGVPFGLTGIAFGYSTAMLLLTIPMILWAIRGTAISVTDITKAIGPPLVSAVVATLIGFGAVLLVGHLLGPVTRLAVGAAVVATSYTLMVLFVMGQKAFYLALLRDSTYALANP